MRVCVVTCWFPSALNEGAGSFVARDVAALAARHQLRVIHLVAPNLDDGVRRTKLGEIPVIRTPMRTNHPGDIARAALWLGPHLAGADVIHTMAAPSLLPLRLMGRLPAPLVHTEHWTGLMPSAIEQMSSVEKLIYRLIFRRPAVVGAVSSMLADAMAGLAGREIRTMPNIVETTGPQPPRTPDGRIKLISIGYLSPVKRPMLAVETLAELRSRGHDAELTWVGTGDLADETRALANRLGVADQVQLVGYQPRAAVDELLINSDVLLHTSTVETFSLVAAEALCAGRPIVIQKAGGYRDFAREPWAQLVDQPDAQGFATGVEQALAVRTDPALVDYAAQLSRSYSAAEFVNRWSSVYREVTER